MMPTPAMPVQRLRVHAQRIALSFAALPRAERMLAVAGALVLAANLLWMLVYICIDYRNVFHSDSAAKSLIAGEIARTHHFFPPDWYHVNGDLMVVFGHILILPFIGHVANGYGLHAFAGVLSGCMLLAAAWGVTGIVTQRLGSRLAFVGLLAGGISPSIAESLYGQVSYGVVLFLALVTIFTGWKAWAAEDKRTRRVWSAAVAAVAFVAYWANPQRAAASYTLPLLAGLACLVVDAVPRHALVRSARPLAAHMAGAVMGYLAHAAVLRHVANIQGAGAARWLSFAEVPRNALGTVQGVIANLGVLPAPGADVVSAVGALSAARVAAAVIIALLLPAGLAQLARGARAGERLLGGFTAASLLLFLFVQLLTTVPDMNDPVMSARYLIPSLVLGLLVLWVCVERGHFAFPARPVAALALGVVALTPWAVRLLTPVATDEARPAAIKALRAAGLNYGYATYWNAGAMTVLAKGKPSIRQIQIVNGLPIPMRHLSSESWYQPEAWTGPTFLMLTDDESKNVQWGTLDAAMGRPARHIRIGAFDVAIYPDNLAAHLVGWNSTLSRPLGLPMNGLSAHTVGTFVGNPARLASTPGQAGFLHYGPYLLLNPGRYVARFDLDSGGAPAQLDIAADGGQRILAAQQPVTAGRQSVALPFDVTGKAATIETRVQVDGRGAVNLYGIKLERRP